MRPYYQDDLVTLYHGDCLDFMGCVSADMIVTDPPYFLPAVHYCTRTTFRRSLSDLSMLEHFYRDWFVAAKDTIGEAGVCYVFCDGQSYPVFFSLAYPHFKRVVNLVWNKQVSFNGYTWRHQHELILFAERENAPVIPTGDGDILTGRAVPVDERDHPAQKPLDVLVQLVAKHIGATVLDPFAGSGATLLAALRMNRKAIGVERDEAYCEIAAKRLEGHVRGGVEASSQGSLAEMFQ